MTSLRVELIEGIDDGYVRDALRVAYEAFANKFRVGFRGPDDIVRLFQVSVDTTSCITAAVDGALVGILTYRTAESEFYNLDPMAIFANFPPLRAARVMLNLMLLLQTARPNEFIVTSLAVRPSSRGMGIGTALMQKAEERARSLGKRTMGLGVVQENQDAIRLYRRLGYRTAWTSRSLLARMATGSHEVRRMEKTLVRWNRNI